MPCAPPASGGIREHAHQGPSWCRRTRADAARGELAPERHGGAPKGIALPDIGAAEDDDTNDPALRHESNLLAGSVQPGTISSTI
jgi:hypothetical protein